MVRWQCMVCRYSTPMPQWVILVRYPRGAVWGARSACERGSKQKTMPGSFGGGRTTSVRRLLTSCQIELARSEYTTLAVGAPPGTFKVYQTRPVPAHPTILRVTLGH
jgi:hypothetical protein